MPNLYGKQEDEEKQDQAGGMPGASQEMAPAGTPADAATAFQGPESSNFSNLENIFSLNKTKAKGMADQATGKVTQAAGGLLGRDLPTPGGLKTKEQAATFNAAPGQPYTARSTQPPPTPAQMPAGNVAMKPSTLAEKQASGQGLGSAAPPTQRAAPVQAPAPVEAAPAEEPLAAPPGSGFEPLETALGIQANNENFITTQQAALKQQQEADLAAKAKEEQDLGKYQKTDELLDSYASDEGQQLLGQNYSALDAEAMNQAGGRDAFAELSKNFQNYDEDFAKQVAGDRGVRQNNLAETERGLQQAISDRDMLQGRVNDFSALNDRLNQPGKQPEVSNDRIVAGGGTKSELDARVAAYAAQSNAGTQVANGAVEILSTLSPENWGNLGDLKPQYRMGKEIASSYGLDEQQSLDAFKQFIGSLPPEVANWILTLTSHAGSVVGQGVGNFFGGWGDALHEFTTGTNSSPDEWAAFQQLFHDWMQNEYGKSAEPTKAPAPRTYTETEKEVVAAKKGQR